MGVGFLSIGVSAINAAQVGLSTAQHNISNASTPGFHRQEISQSTNTPVYTGAGFIGQGVQVTTVQRSYSQYLENQVLSAQTQANQLNSYYQQIVQINNMLADPNSGLSPALQDFYAGLNEVSANPASVPARQSMLSGAEALVSRFQNLDQRFTEIRDGINSNITSSVGLINSYAAQLAKLNEQVVTAQATGNGQPPNDLLDQRDQVIADLNKEIRVTVVPQGDGSYGVFMGKGQPLVLGQQAYSLKTLSAPDDVSRLEIGYVANNTTMLMPSNLLDGGNLGGLLAFRSETLDPAQNALGRVAIGFARDFNDQHRLGQDLNGDLGTDFFSVATGRVSGNSGNSGNAAISASISNVSALTTSNYLLSYDGTNYTLSRQSDGTQWTFLPAALPYAAADGFTLDLSSGTPAAGDSWMIFPTRDGARDISVLTGDTAKIAAAAPIVTSVNPANSGKGTISAGSVDSPPPPNASLQNNVTVAFIDATHFSVTDNTTSTVLAASVVYDPLSGTSISYNGWTVQLSGAPATGDSFTVGPNTNGVADNRNALLLGGLQTTNTLVNGTTSYQGAYSQLVSQVGNKSREIDVKAKAQESLLSQNTQKQQELSGVNLDEEAANLIRYQQAYQAASKMISISSKLFEDLLAAAG